MIKHFSLPGYWEHLFEIQCFIEYHNKYPNQFYEERVFDSAYGMPPNLIWNGGRPNTYSCNYIKYDDVFGYYRNLKDFTLKHTCTNCLLTKDLVNDKDCNDFIKNYTLRKDYIIINSKLLYDHLKILYFPISHFIWSATLDISDIDTVNKLSNNQIVVLEYNYNNNNEYLKQLNHPEHIEIICMEPCKEFCPTRLKHYTTLSKLQLGLELEPDEFINCPYSDNKISVQDSIKRSLSRGHGVTNERVNELSEMGFQYFKISGRLLPPLHFFYILCYYFIKTEYFNTAYNKLNLDYVKILTQRKTI